MEDPQGSTVYVTHPSVGVQGYTVPDDALNVHRVTSVPMERDSMDTSVLDNNTIVSQSGQHILTEKPLETVVMEGELLPTPHLQLQSDKVG